MPTIGFHFSTSNNKKVSPTSDAGVNKHITQISAAKNSPCVRGESSLDMRHKRVTIDLHMI